jgi:hypothetical protein
MHLFPLRGCHGFSQSYWGCSSLDCCTQICSVPQEPALGYEEARRGVIGIARRCHNGSMFSARDPLSPPLDFPVVGLAGSWDHRWVEFFEGELGSAVWSVLLGHLNLESLIIVRTAPRERWNRLQGGGIEDTGLGAFVDGAVIMLVDMARVDGMDERTRYNRGLVTYASNQAKNWRQWESEVWHWNSEPVSARTFSFAHAWLGVSLDDPVWSTSSTSMPTHMTSTSLGPLASKTCRKELIAILLFGVLCVHLSSPLITSRSSTPNPLAWCSAREARNRRLPPVSL